MASFTPSHVRSWLRTLEGNGLASAYRRAIFAHVSTVFTAAVEDRIIHENPCRSRSVKAPRLDPRKVVPWSFEQVCAVRGALDARYRVLVDLAAGCGLRQGEAFGLGADDVDFRSGTLHVVRQVKLLHGRRVFALPKGGKVRDVPLPDSVAASLAAHLTQQPSCGGRAALADAGRLGCLCAGDLSVSRGDGNRPKPVQQAVLATGASSRRNHSWAGQRHACAEALLRIGAARRRGEHQGSQRVPRSR
ncbi:tyrosine-type recombinase/integrase [Streptomyces sp. NBC_00820]|nr:tyrosine-type recombinase/integrase [Streptomyces sp. NBC_00820]